MGKETHIGWTESTWNPFHGCEKVSLGCRYCYMFRDKERYGQDPTVVMKSKANFNEPAKWKEPKLIFTCSWSDWFIQQADEWRPALWDIIKSTPHHTYQILTKRPERILQCLPPDWGDGYDNVWLGISAENDDMFRKRMFELGKVKARVKFVSAEPLLGEIYLKYVIEKQKPNGDDRLDWIIIGGESGNETGKYLYRPCKVEWMETMIQDCIRYDVPVFVKQMGTHLAKELNLKDRSGSDINEFPSHIRLQQFPKKIK